MQAQRNPDILYEKISHGTREFPFQIHQTHHKNGFRLYPHLHQEFELLVLRKGNGIIYVDNKEYHLAEGNGLFINARCIHFGKPFTAKDVMFEAIVFSKRLLGADFGDAITEKYVNPVINNTIALPVLFRNTVPWQKQVLEAADAICAIKDSNPCFEELTVKAQLLNLWRLLFQHASPESPQKADKHLAEIKKITEYINANYGAKLTLAQLAGLCHMSTGHFCRVFSGIMHQSPFHYLMNIRIEKSCFFLKNSDAAIGEIALNCGFGDCSYFSKQFHNKLHCTPSGYRSKHAKAGAAL